MPCITAGAGRQIVLLHGYLSRKESFYYQIEFLSRYFRVIAPDLPGFGGSAEPERPWSVGDYADWFLDFLGELKISGAYVLARSFGARVAFKARAARPCH